MDSYVRRLEEDNARLRVALARYADTGCWVLGTPHPQAVGRAKRYLDTWCGAHLDGATLAIRALATPPPDRTGLLLSPAPPDADDGTLPPAAIWWGGGFREPPPGGTRGGAP